MEASQRETKQLVHQRLGEIRESLKDAFADAEMHKHVVDWFDTLLVCWFAECKAYGHAKDLRIDAYLADFRTLLVNADGLQYRMAIYSLGHWGKPEHAAKRWFAARHADS